MPRKVNVEPNLHSKPFEVIVETTDGPDTLYNHATHFDMLEEDFQKAIEDAKKATAKDGKLRRVEIRQIIRSHDVTAE